MNLVRLLTVGLTISAASAASPASPEFRYYQHNQHTDAGAQAHRVMTRGFVVRGHPPLTIRPPIDWGADPHGDANWRYQVNAMYPLGAVMQALMETGDDRLRLFARSVFLDWIAYNIEQDRPNDYKWSDMATGVRGAYLAQLIAHEQSAGDIDEPDLQRLLNAGRLHVTELADPAKFAPYNHGMFQVVGIAALCEVVRYPACEEARPYADARYAELVRRQFNDEGMHLEHSPAYHVFGLAVFERIERTGLLALPPTERQMLRRARSNLHWMIHPDGGFAAFGDTEAGPAVLAGEYDAKARWLVSQGASGEPPDYGVQVFPATGYGFIRAPGRQGQDSYVMLSVAHHSEVHKHGDSFAFAWSDRGRRVLVDSGKWGYDVGPERDYVTSPRAHNTVEIRNRTWSRRRLPANAPDLQGFEDTGVYGLRAAGELPNGSRARPRIERWVVARPGEWLVVADDVRSLWPSDLVQWFQFPPEAEVVAAGGGFQVRFPWTEDVLHVVSLSGAGGTESHRGDAEGEEWNGWYSPDYHELVPSWQVGFRAQGMRERLVTVFRWARDGAAAPARESVWSRLFAPHRFCWTEAGELAGGRIETTGDGARVLECD